MRKYDEAIEQLRSEALTDKAVNCFEKPARHMEETLRRWVLRRDLRDDPWMQRFMKAAEPKGIFDHRKRSLVPVPFHEMGLQWKRAFMACEALSIKVGGNVSSADKRRRLGFAAGIDADPAVLDEENTTKAETSDRTWLALAQSHNAQDQFANFHHPLIGAAVDLIEKRISSGEKVLVFGRFNAPLAALTHLLDMRELVRRLADPTTFDWPQTGLLQGQRAAFATAFEAEQRRAQLKT